MSGGDLYREFDDRNPAFTYSPGWSTLTDTNAHESTLSYTSRATNATVQFYGTLYSQRYTPPDTDQSHRAPPRKCRVAFWRHRQNLRLESARFPLHPRQTIRFHHDRWGQKRNIVQRAVRPLLQSRYVLPHTRRGKPQWRRHALLGLLPRRTGATGRVDKTDREPTDGRDTVSAPRSWACRHRSGARVRRGRLQLGALSEP
jgi:hypothetical protein